MRSSANNADKLLANCPINGRRPFNLLRRRPNIAANEHDRGANEHVQGQSEHARVLSNQEGKYASPE